MKYKKYILANGLKVVTISGLPNRAVTICAFVKSGFRSDPKNTPGLAHFVEHMVFNGTQSYPSPKEVANAVEKYGGWHSAFTWIEYQKHVVHLPRDYFEQGANLLMETLGSPLMSETEIEREKGVVKEEILTNKSDPYKAIWDYAWFPLFFAKTSLARPYTGTVENIDKISHKDVLNFTARYFNPQNMNIFIAGDFQDDTYVKEKIEQLSRVFIKSKKAADSPLLNLEKNSKKIFAAYDNSYYQTSLAIGFKTVPFKSNKKYVFDVIKEILAGYFGSTLIQKLRDEGGLIYTWNAFQDNLEEVGYCVINTSVNPKNIQRVCRIILNELERLNKGNFSKDELEMAKNHLTGSILANTQTGYDYINLYGQQELFQQKEIMGIDELIKVYKGVTLEAVKEITSKYLGRDNIFIATVGPTSEEELMTI